MARRNSATDCDCTYTFGLSLRKCVRLCAVIGLVSAALYIMAGTSIIVHIARNEKIIFTRINTERTKSIHYKNKGGLFICLAIVLILINVIQIISDVLLFHSTLKTRQGKSLWVFFLLDIILWVMTLICFTAIFSGGGLFLLLVFLLGTAVRAYIIFVLHQFMDELRKPIDSTFLNNYPSSLSVPEEKTEPEPVV